MRHLTATIDIDAPPSAVWELLAEFERWPEWGPSIRSVDVAADAVAPGVTGRVRTIAGVWLPFEITAVVPEQSWVWRVAGVPATGHTLSARDGDRARAGFSVAWVLAPYLLVMRIALRRLKRMAEHG